MKRKREDEVQLKEEVQSVEQRSESKKGSGDGVSWCRGAMIGKGSSGSVYLATLKKPRSSYGCFPEVMAVKSAEISVSGSLQKEREAFDNIGRCPNILRCFGDEITRGLSCEIVYNLLLEYVSGGTLAELIKKSGASGLPESDVRYYTSSILRGLNHIHERGYVHCDLKPENILLVPNTGDKCTKFRVKIGGFGLARRAKSNKKKKLDPSWRGTPMYLSPEAVVDCIQEPPSDIWTLGCIVLEMLTGKPPWDGKQGLDSKVILRQIAQGYKRPKISSTISKDGKEFLKRCFSRKPMYRLTAEMLLHHSFLEGLADDADGETDAQEKMLDANKFDLPLILYRSDEEFGYSSSADDFTFVSEEELSCSSWSEEDGKEIKTKEFSSSPRKQTLKIQESGESRSCIKAPVVSKVIKPSKQVSTKTLPQCPTASIPAGV